MSCNRPTFTFLIFLISSSHAWSQDEISPLNNSEDCTLPNNIPAQPSKSEWRTIRPELAKQLDNCLKNSNFFALYGASLLYTGEVTRALEMLERSLLLNPYDGSARIDYAQALYQSGQLISAIQVNNELLLEDGIPEHIRTFLKQRQQDWTKKLGFWRNQLSYLYGFSNNLNNATHIDELNFTLSGQIFPVIISSENLAHSGNYHYANVTSQYYHLNSNGAAMLNLSLKSRQSELSRSDTDEFKISFEKEYERLNQRDSWSIGIEHLNLGSDDLYSALEGTWRIIPKSHPTMYFGLESRYVDFNGQDILDEISLMLRPGIAIGTANKRLGIELAYGLNNALDERPGGNREQAEASMFYDMALFDGHLTSRISYSETRDKEGYSTLLESNARRETQALSTTLQYFYPINEDWLVHGSYYYRDQESNISLFSTRTRSVEMGFTYRF